MEEAKKMPKTTKTAKTTQPKTPKQSSGLKVSVYDLQGKEVKTVDLSKEVFGGEFSPRLVAQYIRVYQANQRQGTSSTKTRSEVIGSTKKIYRQKGTGNARHGSKKAPIFVGGGVAFGPKPRDYSLSMNKKQRQKALLSSLSQKAKEGSIIALSNEAISMKPKTKGVASFFKTMKLDAQKVLVILPTTAEKGLVLSARNLANIELTRAVDVNPYMLLTNKTAMFVEGALTELEKRLLK